MESTEHSLNIPEAATSLFRLPREIRDKVYQYILVSPGFCAWPIEDMRSREERPKAISPTILRTCHTAYEEAAPILYHRNTFGFDHPSNCNVFRCIMDRNYAQSISSVIFRIREKDRSLWKAYFSSTDPIRSLKCDFPNLSKMGIWIRPTSWWQPNVNTESNFERLLEHPRLQELGMSLEQTTEADVRILCSIRIPVNHFEYIRRQKASMLILDTQYQVQLQPFTTYDCQVYLQLLPLNAPSGIDIAGAAFSTAQ